MSRQTFNYPLFDGEKVLEKASVVIENGKIIAVNDADSVDHQYFLMPGLIDAHTHMNALEQSELMLKSGITATCDVIASKELIKSSKPLEIIGSAGMAMGVVLKPKNFVEKAIASGARYIKVLLFNTLSVGKSALCGIVKAAHERGLKVAVHAIEVSTVKQAVDAGADILLHVPMKEAFPKDLAETIAKKGIVVAPTLVMMETFANSGRNGYQPADYQNAENAVRLLREYGVQILAATDANDGSFAPAVTHGSSLHREMELLVQAGMTPVEVLTSATSKVADVFGIENLGTVAKEKRAVLLLIEGRPDRNITDTMKIRKIYMNGETIISSNSNLLK